MHRRELYYLCEDTTPSAVDQGISVSVSTAGGFNSPTSRSATWT